VFGYRTTTTVFEEIKDKRTLKLKCTVCGKSRQRTLEVSQTINPFNKNKKTGEVKTYSEIVDENRISLNAKIKKFNETPFVCCK